MMTAALHNDLKVLADTRFADWCQSNLESSHNLPIKGRLYGALVVLWQLESGNWNYADLAGANSTDPGKFFGNRSISGHTRSRIATILATHNLAQLAPQAHQGELGRTSTGTKLAGLQFMTLIREVIDETPVGYNKQNEAHALVSYLYELIFSLLNKYQQLGGIEVPFAASESIAAYISKLVDAHRSNSGAVLQHLVGAKLELRLAGSSAHIVHHSSATADAQTGRYGDFDVGSTVFHVTKSANDDHYRKAWQNAQNGRKVYLLVPYRMMNATHTYAENFKEGFSKKVDIFSIEQFVAQNLDELASFDRAAALQQLRRLLNKYNELVSSYETDPSLKIMIPDFGV